MMKFLFGIFLLAGCTSKNELDIPQSRIEKQEFSFGSLLENTSFFKKKDEKLEENKMKKKTISHDLFEKLCASVIEITGASISIANEEKGILLTDWFYNDKRTQRHALQISVKNDIKNSEFLFVREDFIKGKWLPKAVYSPTVKIIQNKIIHNTTL